MSSRWKPGQSGNKSGRPKLPDHLKEIKSVTADEVNRIYSQYWRMPMAQLKALLESNTLTALETTLAMNVMKSTSGDLSHMIAGMDRSIGKVTEKSEVKMESSAVTHEELDEIPREKLMQLLTGND